MDWKGWATTNKAGLGMVGMGLVLSGIGAWQQWGETKSEPAGPAISAPAVEVSQKLTVEIAGAVKQPGVYSLDLGSRVVDGLNIAQGLAEGADTDWVAKNINQAEKLKDGQKIYVPVVQNSPLRPEGFVGHANLKTNENQSTTNINTAGQAELEELWGVGEARAKQIIDNRPYAGLDELVTKAKLPQSVLDKNEGKISVY